VLTLDAMFSRCLLCNFDMDGEELEECGYMHLDDNTHLLHAVVHANGYGHLLRVNGREGGSRCLTGRDIMSFWDRLCKVLHVRYKLIDMFWFMCRSYKKRVIQHAITLKISLTSLQESNCHGHIQEAWNGIQASACHHKWPSLVW
jgi:hypothetical protein